MSQPVNRLLQYAQSTGGAPYDEDAYMPEPGQRGSPPMSNHGPNDWLNERLHKRLGSPDHLTQYMTGDDVFGGRGYSVPNRYNPDERNSGTSWSDMDMMRMYGPEDQVAYDGAGRPIPLADPRHPRNQQAAPPYYPQGRR